MRIALLQVAYDDAEPIAARRERVAALVRQQQGADLVVLPELWAPGGFSYRRWSRDAEPVDGPTVRAVRDAARDLGAVVHAGSIVEDASHDPGDDGHGLYNTSVLLDRSGAVLYRPWPSSHDPGDDGHGLYNTSVLLDRSGAVLATYRKVHRFGFGAGEPRLMDAGSDVVTVPLPGTDDGTGREVVVGLATCYDLRFPEMFRALLDGGARLVVVPAAWPAARVGHWTLLARARAIENQCFLVATNTAGTHANTPMGGRSLVVGPMGDVVAEAGDGEQVLVVDVDLTEVERVRKSFPVLEDRRLR